MDYHQQLPVQNMANMSTQSTSHHSSSAVKILSNWLVKAANMITLFVAKQMEFGTLAIFVVKGLFVKIQDAPVMVIKLQEVMNKDQKSTLLVTGLVIFLLIHDQ